MLKQMVSSTKFSLAQLAIAMASVSIFLAGAKWLHDSRIFDSPYFLPQLVPASAIFGLGFGVAPLIGLGLLIAQVVWLISASPKPHTTFLYLGFLLVGFSIPESATTRHIVVLLITSTASLLECRLRMSSAYWFCMPVFCFGITLCYYLIAMAALASAAC